MNLQNEIQSQQQPQASQVSNKPNQKGPNQQQQMGKNQSQAAFKIDLTTDQQINKQGDSFQHKNALSRNVGKRASIVALSNSPNHIGSIQTISNNSGKKNLVLGPGQGYIGYLQSQTTTGFTGNLVNSTTAAQNPNPIGKGLQAIAAVGLSPASSNSQAMVTSARIRQIKKSNNNQIGASQTHREQTKDLQIQLSSDNQIEITQKSPNYKLEEQNEENQIKVNRSLGNRKLSKQMISGNQNLGQYTNSPYNFIKTLTKVKSENQIIAKQNRTQNVHNLIQMLKTNNQGFEVSGFDLHGQVNVPVSNRSNMSNIQPINHIHSIQNPNGNFGASQGILMSNQSAADLIRSQGSNSSLERKFKRKSIKATQSKRKSESPKIDLGLTGHTMQISKFEQDHRISMNQGTGIGAQLSAGDYSPEGHPIYYQGNQRVHPNRFTLIQSPQPTNNPLSSTNPVIFSYYNLQQQQPLTQSKPSVKHRESSLQNQQDNQREPIDISRNHSGNSIEETKEASIKNVNRNNTRSMGTLGIFDRSDSGANRHSLQGQSQVKQGFQLQNGQLTAISKQFRRRTGTSLKRDSLISQNQNISSQGNLLSTQPSPVLNQQSLLKNQLLSQNLRNNVNLSAINLQDMSMGSQLMGGLNQEHKSLESNALQRSTHLNSSMQRSIRIYKNAVKSIGNFKKEPNNQSRQNKHGNSSRSLQKLQIAQDQERSGTRLPVTQQNILSSQGNIGQVKHTQVGFIDRTIKTSNSQFVSPKTILPNKNIQTQALINPNNTVTNLNSQPIQFFNYTQQLDTRSINRNQYQMSDKMEVCRKDQLLGSQLIQTRFYQNLRLRNYFREWKLAAYSLKYQDRRIQLCRDLSFGSIGNPNVHQTMKLSDKMILSHFKFLRALQEIEIIDLFSDLNSSNKAEKFKLTKSKALKNLKLVGDQLRDFIKQQGQDQIEGHQSKTLIFLKGAFQSVSQKIIETHCNPRSKLQSNLEFTNQTFSLTPTMDHIGSQLNSILDILQEIISQNPKNNPQQQKQLDKVSIMNLINQVTNLLNIKPIVLPDLQFIQLAFNQDLQNLNQIIQNFSNNLEIKQIMDTIELFNQDNQQTQLSDQDLWVKLSLALELIDQHFPENHDQNLRFIILSTKSVRQQLIQKISQQMIIIEKRVLAQHETDTNNLRNELSKSIEILQAKHNNNTQGLIQLSLYIEQLKTLKVFNQEMCGQLNLRHLQSKSLTKMLQDKSPKNQRSSRILENLAFIENYLQNLPQVILDCQYRLHSLRSSLENQMHSGCLTLTQKIQTFQQKYIERYLQNSKSKLNDQDISKQEETIDSIQKELEVRGRMISEIETKIKLYLDCIEIIGLQESFKNFKDVTCFVDFKEMQELHQETQIMWCQMRELSSLRKQVQTLPYFRLDMNSITAQISKLNGQTESGSKHGQSLKAYIKGQKESVSEVVKRYTESYSQFEKRHWVMLYALQFNISTQSSQVRDDLSLMEISDNFDHHSWQYKEVRKLIEWELKVKSILAKEQLTDLDEYRTELKSLVRSLDYREMSEDIEKRLKEVEIVSEGLRWESEIENLKGTLLPYFEEESIVRALTGDHEDFKKLMKHIEFFKEVKSGADTKISNLSQVFQSHKERYELVMEGLQHILKSVDQHFELRRLAFPRFFFISDKQFLEFLDQSLNSKGDFSQIIHLIFPGCQNLLFDKPLNSELSQSTIKAPIPIKPLTDLDQTLYHEVEVASFIMQEGGAALNKSGTKPTEIRGMISIHKELLMFQKPVTFEPSETPKWLQDVEIAMQSTVGQLIGQAVASFPKQSLDEWIMDYPLQTILTTIHLILTHEINELFEDMQKGGQLEMLESSPNNPHMRTEDEEDELDEYGRGAFTRKSGQNRQLVGDYLVGIQNIMASNRTPDTRDLVVATASSHGRYARPVPGAHQRTISLQNLNEDLLKRMRQSQVFQGFSHQRIRSCYQVFHHGGPALPHIYHPQNQLYDTQLNQMQSDAHNSLKNAMPFEVVLPQTQDEEQGEVEEWNLFRRDMFGSDFDLDDDFHRQIRKFIANGLNREDTMRSLQEKSFKGLYLRLQFWINQICKSLNPESDIVIGHQPLQRTVMQTIINFLTYMRDVVYELKVKSVRNIDDFEWQKQIRLTWLGNQQDDTRGCRVDCGAWSTFQANEYIGNHAYRLPLTPLTNKYFVFISAALREKSAVLLRCIPTHDSALDVFQEFSNICTVPLKVFPCTWQSPATQITSPSAHSHVTMRNLMQFLNGAALAQTWIFFEYLDRLEYKHLQTFNKEIQMVQQQFIIAELSQGDEEDEEENGEEERDQADFQRDGVEEHGQLPELEDDNNLDQRQILHDRLGSYDQHSSMYMLDQNQEPYAHNISGGNSSHQRKPLPNLSSNSSRSGTHQQKTKRGGFGGFNKGNKIQQKQSPLINHQSEVPNKPQRNQKKQYNLENVSSKGQSYNQSNKRVDNSQSQSQSINSGLRKQNQSRQSQTHHRKNHQLPNKDMSQTTSNANNHTPKVCFGVFGSISYQFNMRKEKWANEIAQTLQSAFRVLSLTRPELYLITSMFLKSKGFLHYMTLSQALHDAFFRLQEEFEHSNPSFNERFDDSPCTLTVRDLRRLSEIAGCSLSQKKREYLYISEGEDDISEQDERVVIARVVELFVKERLQCLDNSKINIDKLQEIIQDILKSVFQLQDSQITIDKNSQSSTFELILEKLKDHKPICLIGPQFSGKSRLIKSLAQDLNLDLIFFDPSKMGTFKELYGVPDPLTQTYHTYTQQVGKIQKPIFEHLRSELLIGNKLLVVESDFESNFQEMLLPLLEYQTYRENMVSGPFFNRPEQNLLPIHLPNGLMTNLPADLQIVIKQRSLKDASPRLISSMSIFYMRNTHSIGDILKIKLKKYQSVQDKIQMPQFENIAQALTFVRLLKGQLKQSLNPVNEDEIFKALSKTCYLMSINSIGNPQQQQQLSQASDFNFEEVKVIGTYIISREMLQSLEIAKTLINSNKSMAFTGEVGTSKSTLMKIVSHNIKNRDQIWIPQSTFLTFKALRSLINSCNDKPALIMIDDLRMSKRGKVNSFKVLDLLQKNSNKLYDPSRGEISTLFKRGRSILISSRDLDEELSSKVSFVKLDNPFQNSLFMVACIQTLIPSQQQPILSFLQNILKSIDFHKLSQIVEIIKTNPDIDFNYIKIQSPLKILQNDKTILPNFRITNAHKLSQTTPLKFFRDYKSLLDHLIEILDSAQMTKQQLVLDLNQSRDPLYQDLIELFANAVESQEAKQWDSIEKIFDLKFKRSLKIDDWMRKVRENVEIVLIQRENVDVNQGIKNKFLLYEDLEDRKGLDSQTSKVLLDLRSWIIESSQNQPQLFKDYLKDESRMQDFTAIYKEIKEILSSSLKSQLSYYTKYHAQYQSLLQYASSHQSSESNACLTKHQIMNFNLLNIQEKIEVNNQQIRVLEQSFKGREKESIELTKQIQMILKKCQEIEKMKSQNTKFNLYLAKLKSFNSSDFFQIKNALKDPFAQMIIETLSQVLQVKSILDLKPADLSNRLKQMQDQNPKISQQALQNLKQTKIIYKQESLQGVFHGILQELANFQNYTSQLLIQEKKLNALQQSLTLIQICIDISQDRSTKLKEEIEELLIKEKNYKIDQSSQSRKSLEQSASGILKEQSLKNDYMMKALIKQGKLSEGKLDKIKIRIKNLEGDLILMASSITYLGMLPVEQRMKVRQDLAERLLIEANIESSESWSNVSSEQVNSRYFKKVITKNFGVSKDIFYFMNHVMIDSVLAEYLCFLIFTRKHPFTIDMSGIYPDYYTNDLISKHKLLLISSSDYSTEKKIQVINRDLAALINDFQDFQSKQAGKSLDIKMITSFLKENLQRIKSIFTGQNHQVSVPQIQFLSQASNISQINTLIDQFSVFDLYSLNKSEAWIEIKQVLLKHFLPESYQKLQVIIQQIQFIKSKLKVKQQQFDDIFMSLSINQSSSKNDLKGIEQARICYVEIKQLGDDFQSFNNAFHQMINEHPLLASYSNIFVIMYLSLKELSKFTKDITYSWKIYIKMIDMIISKIIRDLTLKQISNILTSFSMKNKNDKSGDQTRNHSRAGAPNTTEKQIRDSQEEMSSKKNKPDKEFTIDEEFFHSVIMPGIYTTIVSGIRQEYLPLFNLIFSLEIALKKGSITEEEKGFFTSKFFKIQNCYDWRLNIHKPSNIPSGFINDQTERLKSQDYINIKKEIMILYPDLRKFFEQIDIKIEKDKSTYEDLSQLLFKKLLKKQNFLYNQQTQQWADLSLFKKIVIGFLCPDNEWRSKLCQFVYEELSTIFDFTEDLNKLHNFIKTASWNLPISLFTQNSINIVNTVCSIASYYGVGLEVLRTDNQQSIKKEENYYFNKEIDLNHNESLNLDSSKPLSDEAATLHFQNLIEIKNAQFEQGKKNYIQMWSKDEMEVEEKHQQFVQSQISLIKQCAENGTWVLISTLKFPSYWKKVCQKLDKMAKKGKILNTFRIFFDLQGYSVQDIPESFLFDHSVRFYLTEKNNEDMEGFNDVWANILNDDLLNAKELNNVYILEQHNQKSPPSQNNLIQYSASSKFNINIESHEQSLIESLAPKFHRKPSNQEDQTPNLSDKLQSLGSSVWTMTNQSQSKKDMTIILPNIVSRQDYQRGGRDIQSPKGQRSRFRRGPKESSDRNRFKNNMVIDQDLISEISLRLGDNFQEGVNYQQSALVSLGQSFIDESSPSQVRQITLRGGTYEETKQTPKSQHLEYQRDTPNIVHQMETERVIQVRQMQIEMVTNSNNPHVNKTSGKRLQPGQRQQ